MTGPTPALWRTMRDRVRRAQDAGDAWVTVPTKTAVRVFDALEEVSCSGVEFQDPRVGYVTVQIDAETWTELQEGKPSPDPR